MKLSSVLKSAVVLGAFLSGAALAQGGDQNPQSALAPRGGFEFGFSTGYGVAMGNLGKDSSGQEVPISDFVSGELPLVVDLGYRIDPHWYVGGRLEGAAAFFKPDCGSGYSCSVTDALIGIFGRYHVLPAARVDPWFGLGISYEQLKLSVDDGSSSSTISYSGPLFATLEAGADYRFSSKFGLGPMVGFSMGEYTSGEAFGTTRSIDKKSLHEWLNFGLRGVFDL